MIRGDKVDIHCRISRLLDEKVTDTSKVYQGTVVLMMDISISTVRRLINEAWDVFAKDHNPASGIFVPFLEGHFPQFFNQVRPHEQVYVG